MTTVQLCHVRANQLFNARGGAESGDSLGIYPGGFPHNFGGEKLRVHAVVYICTQYCISARLSQLVLIFQRFLRVQANNIWSVAF